MVNEEPAKAKWQRVLETYREAISTGQLKAGDRFPNEEEVAQIFNVSRPTAHRALRELAQLGLITRRRRSGSVVADQSRPRTYRVALIVDRIASHFDFPQAEFVNGIHEALGASYGLTLLNSADSWMQEVKHLKAAIEQVDGIIIYPTCEPHSTPALRSAALQRPIVLVDRVPDSLELPCVLPDEEAASREMIARLIDMGHSRVAFLSFDKPEVSSVRRRHAAYARVMDEHGLPRTERFLPRELELNDASRKVILRDVLYSLCSGPEAVTAVFCVQDSIALSALEACESFGIEVPGGLEIACFNEWPAMQLGRPWDVHRIVRNKWEMGRLAGQLLVDQMEGRPVESEYLVPAQVLTAELTPMDFSARMISDWVTREGGRPGAHGAL